MRPRRKRAKEMEAYAVLRMMVLVCDCNATSKEIY